MERPAEARATLRKGHIPFHPDVRVLRAVLALSLCAGSPLVAQGHGTLALVNANVLPMDGDTVLAGQTVLIRDGIIQLVGPSSRVRIPAGTTRIEAGGKYLMPGLADMHVHMAGPRELQEELLKMYVVAAGSTPTTDRNTASSGTVGCRAYSPLKRRRSPAVRWSFYMVTTFRRSLRRFEVREAGSRNRSSISPEDSVSTLLIRTDTNLLSGRKKSPEQNPRREGGSKWGGSWLPSISHSTA